MTADDRQMLVSLTRTVAYLVERIEALEARLRGDDDSDGGSPAVRPTPYPRLSGETPVPAPNRALEAA